MATATLTSKGQMTLPKEIRDLLKLKPKDRVSLIPLPDGTVLMRAKTRSFSDFYGSLYDPNRKPVTLEQMKR